MRSLHQARAVCESYLSGLLDGLAGIPFERREAPGGATLPVFRSSYGPALVIPQDYGGLGAGQLDAVRVMRAAAAPSLAVATTMHHFSVATLFAFTDGVRKSGMEWALLEAITNNDLLGAPPGSQRVPGSGHPRAHAARGPRSGRVPAQRREEAVQPEPLDGPVDRELNSR